MVKARLSPIRALKAATTVAAEFLGHDLGVLAPGKLANIVAMRGDQRGRPALLKATLHFVRQF